MLLQGLLVKVQVLAPQHYKTAEKTSARVMLIVEHDARDVAATFQVCNNLDWVAEEVQSRPRRPPPWPSAPRQPSPHQMRVRR